MRYKKLFSAFLMGVFLLGSLQAGTAVSTSNEPSASWGQIANENYWYSRYYLGHLEMRSGAGLHLVFSPVFQGNLQMMMTKIKMAANITHASPPLNAFPIFAEFGSATPKFVQPVDVANPNDFGTLRWDLSTADRDLYPAALAQSGLKNVLWSEEFFSKNHVVDSNSLTDDPVDSSQTSLTGTVALGKGKANADDYTTDGFRGFVLTAELIHKMQFLKNVLAVNIADGTLDGHLDPATNAADYYFAHRYTYETQMVTPTGGSMPMPKPENFSVVDSRSELWDQLSLLWMASKFFAWAVAPEQDDVFGGDGTGQQPFPGSMAETGTPGPADLAQGLAKTAWLTLVNGHWNAESKTFVDEATVNSGSLTAGTTVTTNLAAKVIIALAQWSAATNDAMNQTQFVRDQANFLIDNLQREDGGFDNSYDLVQNAASSSARTAETQGSAIRGLITAYNLTGDIKFKEAAINAFRFMENNLWDDDLAIFRSSEGATVQVYDPGSIASVVAGLRSIMGLQDEIASPLAHYRLLQFFENAVDKSGFQLSEGPATGGGDDNDTIPPPPMQKASGAANGMAPMPAGEIQLSDGSWKVTDYTFYTDKGMYAANEFFLTGLRGPFIASYRPPSVTYEEAVNTFHGANSNQNSIPLLIGGTAILALMALTILRRKR
ncbi:MAG: hypothetical protein D6732_12520 [Methanobacteriota archaeon]|nr:MAG: hypothetical protein D6732_12520 [Euryarchaeota archaeon]